MKSFKDYVAEAEQSLAEKAVSQQQQKFMGMVHAMQKGKKVKGASPELKKVASTMGKKDAKDFASTKHKGLPKKVGEEQVNEIDVDALNQFTSHAINTLGHGGTNVAAAATGAALGGAIAGAGKKAIDWYQKRKEQKREKERQQQQHGVEEDAVDDFLAKGGQIQHGKLHKPRKAEKWQGSAHIGAAGGKGSKGTVSGLGANTNPKGGKPVVTADINESMLNDDQGSTFDHIIDRFKHEVKHFRQGGELDEHLYDALYDYYTSSGEMPYGVAKARTGDPYNWISFRLDQDLGMDEAAVRPEDIPAFQRKAAGKDFPVSMAQVQDQSDKISDLATLRKMAGLPYKPPASIPIK